MYTGPSTTLQESRGGCPPPPEAQQVNIPAAGRAPSGHEAPGAGEPCGHALWPAALGPEAFFCPRVPCDGGGHPHTRGRADSQVLEDQSSATFPLPGLPGTHHSRVVRPLESPGKARASTWNWARDARGTVLPPKLLQPIPLLPSHTSTH